MTPSKMIGLVKISRSVLLCLLLCSFGQPAFALEKVTVQLKWLHHFQFAGYYAAVEKGFYRDAGLDVILREGGPETEVEREVVSGRADFGIGTSAILLNRAQGQDLVVLGQVFQHSPAVFLTPRKTGIRSIADMAGRRFMFSNQHGDMLALLKKNRIGEDRIVKIRHGGDPKDLISGKADVMIAYNFNEPFALEQVGEPYLIFSPLSSGIDFYGDNFFTTGEVVRSRPDAARKFREATLRGWQYALNNKLEVVDLIREKYSRRYSREWLVFEANQIDSLVQPDLIAIGHQNPERWRHIAQVFVDLGMLPSGFDPAPVMYSPVQDEDHRQLIAAIVICSVIIVFLTCLLITFRRLNRKLVAEMAERKQAESALRESEAKFSKAFDTAPVLMSISTIDDGTYIDINQKFAEVSGFTREDAVGRTSAEIGWLAPEDRLRLLSMLARERRVKNLEVPLTNKQGEQVFCLYSCEVVDFNGQKRLLSIALDITDRKRAEGRLASSEENYRLLFFNNPLPMWMFDHESRHFLEVNNAAIAHYGYTREEFLSMTLHDLMPSGQAEDFGCCAEEGGDDSTVWNHRKPSGGDTWQHRKKDGTIIDVEVVTNDFLYQGRQSRLVLAVDVTERNRALNLLKMRDLALSRISDAVYFCSPEGKIIDANEAASAMLGYRREELLTLSVADIDPLLAGCGWAHHWESFRQAGKLDFETVHLTKGGEKVPVVITSIYCVYNAQEYSCAIVRDERERRMMQEEMIKNQKLESLGVLAGGIAHDFNNILTAITGNISLCRMHVGDNHRAAELLHQAEKATQRASDLAYQLLTFARGSQPIKKTIRVEPVIESSASLVLRGSNVISLISCPPDLYPIEADEGQLSQAFNNVIINAAQAMPTGGTVTIEARNLPAFNDTAALVPPGAYVEISVADTGCGMPEETLQRIFDPYFTTKAGGSGLGLASVHSIIKKHGGHIRVRSEPGKGTTFTILMPASDPSVNLDEQAAAAPLDAQHGASLLVMDDDAMVRDVTVEMLRELGYHVEECADGEEAIMKYADSFGRGRPFDAVIMDLTVAGGMGGREAAARILEIDPGARLIVASGYSNDPVLAEPARHGFRAAVVKPFDFVDLNGVILAVLPEQTESAEKLFEK